MTLILNVDQLNEWKTKKLKVVVTAIVDNEHDIEIVGELHAVHELAIMLRPKGRLTPDMIETEKIKSIVLLQERAKPITSKRIPEIAFGNIRQHLADRHGLALDEVNHPDYTEAVAYDFHLSEHAPGAEAMSHHHEG